MSVAGAGTRPVTFRATFTGELRARREQVGLLQREFAEKAHVSLSSVKQYEAGKKKPGREFAAWCDDFYGCPGTFVRLYDGMVAESYPSWFGPRVLLEDRAARIHEWEMRGIPGLLQTRAYASAVIRACRPYDAGEDLDRDVAARIERQGILMRDDPPKLWVVLGEGVLRQAVGGARVMREQLGHLLSLAESRGIVLQVLPFTVTDAPGVDGPAALFEFDDGPAVAYLEGWGSGRILEDPKEVAEIATALSMIKGCALSPADSAQLMAKIRREYE
ncbi:MAG TPA: helix-turn-helix transcriptional regulator [Streptosporangiaceae bacterium]|nr:helix-turn-helix transcriptional regulator [Streptosporangiaceae bacterium]